MAQAADPVALFAELEMMRSELKHTSRALAGEKRKKVRLEEAVQLACRASFATMKPLRVAKPKKDGRKKAAEVANINCADWHLGFDSLEESRRLVLEYRDKIVELTQIQRADHPVEDAHIPFLGDICHGEQIYPSSPYEQDASLIDQAVTDGAALVCEFIVSLLSEFRHAHVPWLAGNHGWLGARKGGVYDPDSNLDRAMGFVVKGRLEAAGLGDRVTFEIPRAKRKQFGSMTVDRIGEWSALLMHGHQLKGGSSYGGLPFYGFNRKGLQFGDLGFTGILPRFKDITCGHYHVVASIPIMSHQLRVCGSLQSATSYAVEQLAAYSPPAQFLTFVHPQGGEVTAEYPVRL